MEDILKPFRIHVAILPINGNKPGRKVAGNLDSKEAANLGLEIGAGLVIPCHYDMFTFNTTDSSQFARFADELHQPCQILQCGEPWDSGLLA